MPRCCASSRPHMKMIVPSACWSRYCINRRAHLAGRAARLRRPAIDARRGCRCRQQQGGGREREEQVPVPITVSLAALLEELRRDRPTTRRSCPRATPALAGEQQKRQWNIFRAVAERAEFDPTRSRPTPCDIVDLPLLAQWRPVSLVASCTIRAVTRSRPIMRRNLDVACDVLSRKDCCRSRRRRRQCCPAAGVAIVEAAALGIVSDEQWRLILGRRRRRAC